MRSGVWTNPVLAMVVCATSLTACQKQAAIPPAAAPSAAAAVAGNPDMSQITAAVDADSDGRLTQAEWLAQGLPASSFNGMARGRGYVTQHDYEINAAPPGIDGNADGVLSVEEFRAFDRRMNAQMPAVGTR